jgi:hypothetical protein
MSLLWIPKGILEKERKNCFSYLWRGTKDKQVFPWVQWERIEVPKALRGWGLKKKKNSLNLLQQSFHGD